MRYKVLSQFQWSEDDMGEVMLDIQEGLSNQKMRQPNG